MLKNVATEALIIIPDFEQLNPCFVYEGLNLVVAGTLGVAVKGRISVILANQMPRENELDAADTLRFRPG